MSRPDWGALQQEYIAEYTRSGISPVAWCEARGLNYATARRYIKKTPKNAQTEMRKTAQKSAQKKSAQTAQKRNEKSQEKKPVFDAGLNEGDAEEFSFCPDDFGISDQQAKFAMLVAQGKKPTEAYRLSGFFKGEIGKTHLAQELWTQIDNGQLAPDLAEIRTSITDVSNEITQTVNKKLEDQSAAIQQIQKVQVDTNNNLNSMWAVKLQQMQDGRLYIAGIGAGIENTPAGMQSQVLLAADRIAMINPANGNTKPMFVGQGDQIFMNDVFLKRLTAPTITSGGNPPAFSLTPDGRLTAKNADISGSVNANAGTLNNVTINENCRVLGKLSANQIEGDLVKTVGKAFPRDSRAPERWPSGTIT